MPRPPDDAAAIFAAEFDDLVSLAAQNVSIEIRPSPDVEVIGVLNEYPSLAVDGGVQVQVGDAYAGQSLRAVLGLRVPALAALGVTTALSQSGLSPSRWTDEIDVAEVLGVGGNRS